MYHNAFYRITPTERTEPFFQQLQGRPLRRSHLHRQFVIDRHTPSTPLLPSV
jgi:hypothetical protein